VEYRDTGWRHAFDGVGWRCHPAIQKNALVTSLRAELIEAGSVSAGAMNLRDESVVRTIRPVTSSKSSALRDADNLMERPVQPSDLRCGSDRTREQTDVRPPASPAVMRLKACPHFDHRRYSRLEPALQGSNVGSVPG
jgi:hypothetical protein